MTRNQKINQLINLAEELKLRVACDEEWNTIYSKWAIQLGSGGNPIIFGLDGSEEDI